MGDQREESSENERLRVASALRFADTMALLMVAATAFSAFATWRTASIAAAIYSASERAYVGVESVVLDASKPEDPRVLVNYKNYGNISAQETRVLHRMTIDQKLTESATAAKQAGILSPSAPHHIRMHIPIASYDAIIAGRSSLEVEFVAAYAGAQGQTLCYLERFIYVPDERQFEVNGGTNHCEAQQGLWPDKFSAS